MSTIAIYTNVVQWVYLPSVHVGKCEINNELSLQPGERGWNSMSSLLSRMTHAILQATCLHLHKHLRPLNIYAIIVTQALF